MIPSPLLAQPAILINEFTVDSSPQRVEIFNTTSQEADISNWFIDDNGGKTYFTIPQKTIIYPQSCLVFSDNFYLNKSSGDTIRLFNNTAPPTSSRANLIDSFSYLKSPGKNTSFFRSPDGTMNWATGEATIGLFNQLKTNCVITPTPTLTPSPTLKPTPTPISINPPIAPSPQLYNNIYLSEAMVNPKIGDNEWVELYNDNDYQVNLTNWYLDDEKDGGNSPKKFSLSITAKGYRSVELNNPIFNNNGDSVRLLNQNQTEVDSFNYQASIRGLSWGRKKFSAKDYCQQNPSKNKPNTTCYQKTTLTSTSISYQLKSSSAKKEMIKNKNRAETALKRKKIIKLPKPRKKGEVLAAKTEKFIPLPNPKKLSLLNLTHSLSLCALINSGIIILHFLTQKIPLIV